MPQRLQDQDNTRVPPLETNDLRVALASFLDTPVVDDATGRTLPIGNYRWGVYVFYDFDGEPIYVGQTNERLRTRIRRHLTNQRTDAVAMSVLDPFEVFEIEVWPLPQFDHIHPKMPVNPDKEAAKAERLLAKNTLNALEHAVYERAIAGSEFRVILNEKNPPPGVVPINLDELKPFRHRIVSDRVDELRSHPDFRLARRALVISRLAQVISERQVKNGLRRVLLTQAKRLEWLARRRFEGLGGEAAVATDDGDGDDED